ncbi:MAG TPA: calcium-binding protein, partial [Allosphingosinicella sp.]|nr:calcium-binding protein [Allosphingosinicella sp.]
GDDVLEGGDGNDILNPGRGDDLVDGGEGNDVFRDTNNGIGSKGFVGGGGDDSAYFYRSQGGDTFVGSGGDGNDYFSLQILGFSGWYIVDAGAGDDLIDVVGNGQLTLGAGQDLVRMIDRHWVGEQGFIIHDFAAGDTGDRLEFSALYRHFTNFVPGSNPFATGHLRLIGSGADTVILADLDGSLGGGGSPIFVGTLEGVSKYSLTAHNIGGFAMPFTVGTAADEIFQGNGFSEEFVGGGGNDTFLVGFGGNDVAVGGAGNDLFYVAVGVPNYPMPSVNITGGGGSDILQVQGKFADMHVVLRSGGGAGFTEAVNATGIGTVQFLSGFDSSRGWAPGGAVRYVITIENGFAPLGAPLILDTTRLAASEGLVLGAGSIKDDGAFVRLVGGDGEDQVHAGAGGSWLEGGGGDDEFFAGVGDDTFYGGAGSDYLVEDVGKVRSGTDYLDGGEGNDVLELIGSYNGKWTSVTIKGGGGDDLQEIDVRAGLESGVADIDLGTGNDRLKLVAAFGTFNIALGAGRDTVEISTADFGGIEVVAGPGKEVVLTDFDAGPNGDMLDWATALNAYLANGYTPGQNPFDSGHARLIQDGGDVLLQVSRLADGNFLTLLRFQNRVVADFGGGLGGFVQPAPDGTAGDDVLVGSSGPDVFDGKAGNDSIDGGAGADQMAGGTGNDIFYVDDAGDVASENAGEGTDEIRTSLASYSLVGTNVENLRATNGGAHQFRGNNGNNVLTGGTGNDFLLIQDGGDDTASGGDGNDVIYFGSALSAGDVADGGAGRDAIVLQGDVTAVLTDTSLVGIESISIQSGA